MKFLIKRVVRRDAMLLPRPAAHSLALHSVVALLFARLANPQ